MAVKKPRNLTVNYEGAWKELFGMIPRFKEFFPGAIRVTIDSFEDKMKELEKKHKNMVTLKRSSDSKIVSDCVKARVEAQMETIHLKKKLGEQKADIKYSEKANEIIGEIINKIYRYNTTYDMLKPQKHTNLSPCDIYVVGMLEELRLLLPHIRRMVSRNVKGIIKIDDKTKSKRNLFEINLITVTDDSLEFNLDMKVTEKKFEYYKNAFDKGEDISWHGLKMRIVELNYRYPEGDKREGMTFRYLRKGEKKDETFRK